MSCDIYAGHSVLGTVTAAGLGLGIFASYVPQQFTIVVRKSTEGINPYFLLLMNLGSSFAFTNVLFLTRPILSCCRSSIGHFDCFGSLLGAIQLLAGFLGPSILLILGVKYREAGKFGRDLIASAKLVAVVNVLSWILVVSVNDLVWQRRLATYFGLSAVAVGLVQYLPQLWTTWHLKHTGSLSIMMLLIQIPGGYLWCLSLALRKGSHWSTWVSLFLAATFQLVLLLMAIFFKFKSSSELAARMAVPRGVHEPAAPSSVSTPSVSTPTPASASASAQASTSTPGSQTPAKPNATESTPLLR